ncbi:MAG TPA: rod shape-determining protein MreC [Candidatus Binatia bacterium]|nr:rod shape-determining protein MreC [Candidatus Binatia bacterium]
MLEFLRRNQVLLSSGLFLLLSLALLAVNRGRMRRFDPLGAVFLEVLRPLQSVTTQATGGLGNLWTHYVSLVGMEAENRELRLRLRRLEAERQRDVEIELENRRLARLLDFQGDVPSQVVTARVIGKDASGLFESFVLDRGERNGIKSGMAVVSADGVVGRIAQASPHASRVLLISDHNSGVDAIVQRTRARGIVEGALNRTCSMRYVKRGEEIDVNDVIVTSGLDGIFPKGILIGRVSGVTRKDFGLFQVAEVVPAVDFAKLEEVLVLTSPPHEVNVAIDALESARATPEPTAAPTAEPTPTPSPAARRHGTPPPAPRASPAAHSTPAARATAAPSPQPKPKPRA